MNTVCKQMAQTRSLQNSWSFWFFSNEDQVNWHHNLVKLDDVENTDDFSRCLYYHMKQPSNLKEGQDYAVFKRGIRPVWEDPANKRGGRWILHICKNASQLDVFWLEMVLFMIGENFGEFNNLVCGASVNIRNKMDRVSLWTRTLDKEVNMAIGTKIKEYLNISVPLQYRLDEDNNSRRKDGFIRSTEPVIAIFFVNNRLYK